MDIFLRMLFCGGGILMQYNFNRLRVELPVNQAVKEAVENREDILVIINGNCFRFKMTDITMCNFSDKVSRAIVEGMEVKHAI
jgi:hypothetical protein